LYGAKKINILLSFFLSYRNSRVNEKNENPFSLKNDWLVPPERGNLQPTLRLKEKIRNPLLEKL
jgi:hypothetical protein